MANDVEVSTSPIAQRSSEDIGAEIGQATAARDIKRLRELASELSAAIQRESQREVNERNERKATMLNPVKDQMTRLVERTDGLVDFIKDCGGVLSFSLTYSLVDGSTEGPVIAINASDRAIPSVAAKKTSTAGGTSSSDGTAGANRGKLFDQYGKPLAELFELVATADDREALEKRMASAGTEKSKNSAAWAVKSSVVNRAIEANHPGLPQRVG